MAGNYLIDVDGRLSINQIQRLPGRKLAIAFGDSTIEALRERYKSARPCSSDFEED
ncbi:hypothetical protein ACT691_13585 [Vibrio metschnikovii]